MPSIKEVHATLDKKEPFTKKEKRSFDTKTMAFIRNLQISRGINKKDAINLYAESNLKSKEFLKKLAKETRKNIENRYPRHKVFKVDNENKFEKPIVKTQKKRVKTEEQKTKAWKKEEKEKLKTFLSNARSKTLKNYPKIVSAHKTYPDATLYELQKGVNSRASEKYRLNHVLSADYTGRIKEK